MGSYYSVSEIEDEENYIQDKKIELNNSIIKSMEENYHELLIENEMLRNTVEKYRDLYYGGIPK
jgi:hypothetical protein